MKEWYFMKIIENTCFPQERDLYNQVDLVLNNCRFKGEEDGESALKECKNIELNNCYMDLRYPLWHDDKMVLNNVTQTENCRAAIWYSNDIVIRNSSLLGIKAIRECKDILIENSTINSLEFGWKSGNFTINNSSITSQYIFFLAKNLKASNSKFYGKYGFQYMENVYFENCYFDTKDAFWHGKNILVKDSVVKGEYLGWYSTNLTFINCQIIGIQPLCYCENLKLINCTMEDANFAFEYSSVDATINGFVESIKNPKDGHIVVDSVGEVLLTPDSKYESKALIEIKKQGE